ncbi:MAG: hypothetical protein MPJ78_04930 [Hyphomicrobiaceae bacterium]|nr:hypothetical protein [Hyphomicrobiaceae bacterium]
MNSIFVLGAIAMLLLGIIFGYIAAGRRSGPTKAAPEPVSKPPAKPAPAKKTAAKKKDDLKKISGVGPALEKKLHGLGVTTYQQIADWKAADIKEVDEKLNFKGRIQREGWVKQAKILASGGETEFSRRKK